MVPVCALSDFRLAIDWLLAFDLKGEPSKVVQSYFLGTLKKKLQKPSQYCKLIIRQLEKK